MPFLSFYFTLKHFLIKKIIRRAKRLAACQILGNQSSNPPILAVFPIFQYFQSWRPRILILWGGLAPKSTSVGSPSISVVALLSSLGRPLGILGPPFFASFFRFSEIPLIFCEISNSKQIFSKIYKFP